VGDEIAGFIEVGRGPQALVGPAGQVVRERIGVGERQVAGLFEIVGRIEVRRGALPGTRAARQKVLERLAAQAALALHAVVRGVEQRVRMKALSRAGGHVVQQGRHLGRPGVRICLQVPGAGEERMRLQALTPTAAQIVDQRVFAAFGQLFGLPDVEADIKEGVRIGALARALEQEVFQRRHPPGAHPRAVAAAVGRAVQQRVRAEIVAVAHHQIVGERRPETAGQGWRGSQVPALVKKGPRLGRCVRARGEIVAKAQGRPRRRTQAGLQVGLP
jgi:hypothetical protein